MSDFVSVAIDGPSGAGKSTLARAAAKELGYEYVDTGACYRAVALYLLQNKIPLENQEQVAQALPAIQLALNYRLGEQRVMLQGQDVSEKIRIPQITSLATVVAAIPAVREWLLGFQRQFAQGQNVIMDGRDIGTVVLPNATVKIFLSASAEERARRRYEEFLAKGEEIEYNKVLEDMRARDLRDSTREIAPLQQAEDAISLNTTGWEFETSLARILEIIKGREA